MHSVSFISDGDIFTVSFQDMVNEAFVLGYGVLPPPRIGELHFQDGVSPAKWVGHRFLGQWIGHPLTVHDQTIFVVTGCQCGFLQPVTVSEWMHGFGFGVPVVEGARDANRGGGRMCELKANGHKLRIRRAAVLMAASVIVILIVFHIGPIDWVLWRNLFAEHFCDDEDDQGAEKTSASQKIYQGVTNCGKHVRDYQCNHSSIS